jgi:hypothetical protein
MSLSFIEIEYEGKMALLVAGYGFVAIPTSTRKEKCQNGHFLALLTAQHIGVVRKNFPDMVFLP